MAFALIASNGLVVQVADASFEVPEALTWVDLVGIDPAPQPGWTWTGQAFHAPETLPVAEGPRYVPLSLIRERVTAAGKWGEFTTALDALPADKRWHLLTLSEGVAADDADAVALLRLIGADPATILA